MSTYEPGTVAVATVRGVPNVRITLDPNGDWFSRSDVEGFLWHEVEDVTDVRALVVLDLDEIAAHLEGADRVQAVLNALRDESTDSPAGDWTTNQNIAKAIEAQTKPPRIPEPGLWAVVEAGHALVTTRRWVHHEEDRWVADDGTVTYWVELRDPVLVRDGIEGGE